MKTLNIIAVLASTLLFSTAGYAANNEEQDSHDCGSKMGASEHMSETGSGMHGGGMMHSGMSNHHMMQSGVSPVTIMIQPGTMPMWGNSMMQQGWGNSHKRRGEGRDGKKRHQSNNKFHAMRKEHMKQIEQRLQNIEALLTELVELQKSD